MKRTLFVLFVFAVMWPVIGCFGGKDPKPVPPTPKPPVVVPEPPAPPEVVKEGCMEAVCAYNDNEPICLRAFDDYGNPIKDGGGAWGTPSVYWYGKMGDLYWERGAKMAGITNFSWEEAAQNGFYWNKEPASFDGRLNARGEFFGRWYVTLCKEVK